MKNIPLFKNTFNESHVKALSEVITRQKYWANGPEISLFEKQLASFSDNRFGLVFNSGTSAGHALMDIHNVKDREVIVPSFTFIATANSVIMAGGKPIFADIEDKSFGLDPKDVVSKITDKTVAIMPIHYGGTMCDISPLKEIAKDNGLLLIEDAAESLGATYDSKPAGSFGDSAWFSFTPTKVISTGEGGAIVTNNRELYERAKLFRSHGRVETEDYFTSTQKMDYISLGYNFRMPSICAALGIEQLKIIGDLILRRQEIARAFDLGLSDLSEIKVPHRFKNRNQIYQMYSILVSSGKERRDNLQEYLLTKGITTKIYFDPIHLSRYYLEQGYDIKLKVTEQTSDKILSLPIYPDLEDDEITYIIESIREFTIK